MDDFLTLLRPNFRGEISTDSADLDRASQDASLFTVRPQLVVFPRDSADLQVLVSAVNQANQAGGSWSLTARAAGTDMTGGPLSASIVVDITRYFNQIKTVGKNYAVVEPGVFYRDFEKETLKRDLLLPSYTASRELCTVGGMVANNAGGEKTLAYGKTARYVTGLKMVWHDGREYSLRPLSAVELAKKISGGGAEGEIYQALATLLKNNQSVLATAKPPVSKNSSGYSLWDVWNEKSDTFDLNQLMVGSQGTLGIITEITFALIRPKKHSRLLVIFLRDLNVLPTLVSRLLAFKPESLESYDDHTFKLAVKLFPQLVKRLKGNAFILALRFLPEFWSVLTGGLPKLVILADFTADSDQEAATTARTAIQAIADLGLKSHLTSSAEEAEKYWLIRRESFNLLRHHVHNKRTAPFIDDFTVAPKYLPEFLPQLYALLDQYQLIYTVAGHIGDGNFHIIPLMDFCDPRSKKIVAELGARVYQLVVSFHGSISGEHNDGLIRGPFLRQVFGSEVYGLFEQTKKIFDPHNIFNPGKKIGATLEYALAHIKEEK